MKANQIAIVEIRNGASDQALFVDGWYIIGADPAAGDSVEAVNDVAEALSSATGVDVTRLEYNVRDDEWYWGEVEHDLKKLTLLHDAENDNG